MRRGLFDGRRFLVQVLLGVNVLIWGTCVAWADDQAKAAESKPAEYVSKTFESGDKNIRVWRFDPTAAGRQPAVLLLHGADGGVGVEENHSSRPKGSAPVGLGSCRFSLPSSRG